MDPERWRHIERLYHSALERPSPEREAFLETACGSDEDLRLEVQALLSRAATAENFLDRPAAEVAAQMVSQPATPILTGLRFGAYVVQAPLGAGGMGVVYRALDTKLNRPVAIKFLSADLADPAARRRFQREAQTASSLNHPHILTVHDAGEFEDRQYLVTEFVDGGTLRDWTRGARHGWRQTIELLIGIADGLAAAHQAGILHRDIKPENILIAKNGYAKLADFGLAKLYENARSDQAPTVTDMRTRPGVIVGTAAYMSPEQALGQRLDTRSDIFSFGVVLYEALAERRPFTGTSDLDIVHAIAHRTAEPLPEDVPLQLRAIVEKALEKDPADRFQSMRDLVVDLRRMVRLSGDAQRSVRPTVRMPRQRRYLLTGAVAIPVLLVAAGAVFLVRSRLTPPAPTTTDAPIRSIAVMPLENLSNDPAQEYFVEGLQEGLITDLARIGIQKVIAKPSTDTFKGTKKSPRDIGRELRVGGLITGSVMRADNRVQVTAQLVRAENGEVVWANRYDRTAADILSLQNDLVGAIAREVRANLSPEQKARLVTARTVNPAANDAYLRARSLYAVSVNQQTKKSLDDAIAEFERSIQIDPTYAPPYAALSVAYQSATQTSFRPPRDTFPKARAAALKAVELDGDLAAAYGALAGVYLWYDWNWDAAEREIERALQLNPDSVDALIASQNDALLVRHRVEDARRTSQRILDLDPINPFSRLQMMWVSFFARQYDESIQRAQTLKQLSPNNPMSPFFLVMNYAVKGMGSEVAAECESLMRLLGGLYEMQPIGTCAWASGIVGHTAEARRLLRTLEHPPAGVWLDPAIMAIAYGGIGDLDRSLDWARRGIEERAPNMIYMKAGPPWDPLRGDPRFQALLRQMNFPP